MTKKKENGWKSLTMTETLKRLKKELGKEYIWEGQLETIENIEWELGWKGRRLLCRMEKEAPYFIRYRLVGERLYEKDKPELFIEKAKQMLLHLKKK